MEFNFNSFGNSKQTISYCEVDKCKAVIKLKNCLQEIKKIITEFAEQDILTFPDLSREQNYKLIQKQCGEPIIKILQKISECEGNDE